MTYLNFLSNFLSENVNFHKKRAKNKKVMLYTYMYVNYFCLTRVLYNHLSVFSDNNNVIPPSQIGFKKGSRTSDHVLVLKSLIDKYINGPKKSYLYVCFIDFSAAFNTIWRNALLYQTVSKWYWWSIFKGYQEFMYSSVLFSVKCDTKLTDSFETKVGVKQGCVLSPIFFNIFLSDLPDIFDSNCHPVKLNNTSLHCLLYADDLIILSERSDGLQCGP